MRYIVKYTDVGGASCLSNSRIKYFSKCIVEYIVIVGASWPGIGELNIYVVKVKVHSITGPEGPRGGVEV
jgi:hypothetical protein